jgi:hypothetical protein
VSCEQNLSDFFTVAASGAASAKVLLQEAKPGSSSPWLVIAKVREKDLLWFRHQEPAERRRFSFHPRTGEKASLPFSAFL